MTALCHPERKHYALEMCVRCYHRYYRRVRVRLGRPVPDPRRKLRIVT